MRMQLGLKTSVAVLAASTVGFGAQQAEAATIIELSDGVTTQTVVDQGPGDLSLTPGVVVFSGVVGVFNVNVTTGLSKPLLGSDSAISRSFSMKKGSVQSLKDLCRCGCSPKALQTRCTVDLEMLARSEMSRVVQCVAFFGFP